jgi:hypothetical protein
MRGSRDPNAPLAPRAPQNSAIPLAFLTRYADATYEPTTAGLAFLTRYADATYEPTTAGLASASPPTEDTSTRSKNPHTDVAISCSELAQDEPASSATLSHPRAAQIDNANLTTTSTPPTASFLGIPTEVRYMIYSYSGLGTSTSISTLLATRALAPSSSLSPKSIAKSA